MAEEVVMVEEAAMAREVVMAREPTPEATDHCPYADAPGSPNVGWLLVGCLMADIALRLRRTSGEA